MSSAVISQEDFLVVKSAYSDQNIVPGGFGEDIADLGTAISIFSGADVDRTILRIGLHLNEFRSA